MLVITGAVSLAVVLPAGASLGGDAASIQADQVHLQGTRTMKTAASYTVHEIQAANGTKVREYISPAGKVFAVAFRGPWLPDMRQLLGDYFEPYSHALQAPGARRARRPIMIEQPGLTVQIGGHLRDYAGRAYAPDMMPSGVTPEDIQ